MLDVLTQVGGKQALPTPPSKKWRCPDASTYWVQWAV
jgi:hypothetical protein